MPFPYRPTAFHVAAASLLLMTACVPAETDMVVIDPPAASSCGADAMQSLVGKSAKVLETMKFGVVTRIIRPDMGVTMDYVAERLNIEIDKDERIIRVSCG